MKSPFAIFRKHQRILTVILTGLAMFAFVILGSVGPSSGQGLPPTLMVITGTVVGAGLMWFVGSSTGNPRFLSTAGAILGAAIAFWMVRTTKAQPPVQTSIGSYTDEELRDLVSKRQRANSFLQLAWQETHPVAEGETPSSPPSQFLFPEGRNVQEYFQLMVTAELLRHEGRTMGIAIGDEVIVNFINDATEGKMTSEIFEKVTGELKISGRQLYEILREELLARSAAQLLAPSELVFTPDEYWELYRKFNVNETLDLVAVPLAPFTADVKAPSDSKLKAYFEKAKTLAPQQVEPGEPAFLQPTRVRFAYLEADYRAFERKVPEPTEEEVKEYYDLNKDTLYRNFQRIPDSPMGGIPGLPTRQGQPREAGPTKTEDEPLLPQFAPDEDKSAPTEGETDGDAAASDPQKKSEPKTSDTEKQTEAEKKPDAKTPGGGKAAKPSDASGATPDGKDETALLLDARGTTPVALLDETSQDAAAAKNEAQEKGDEKSAEPQPKLPKVPVLENRPPAPPLPRAAQFRPLDEDLKAEIRDALREQDTRTLMRETIEKAQTALFDVRVAIPDVEAKDQQKARREADEKTRKRYIKTMKELAETLGLKFVQTPPLSAAQFEKTIEIPPSDPDGLPIERPKYSLSAGSEPSEIEFQRTPSVTQLVYGGDVDTFQPSLAAGSVTADDGFLSPNRFVYVVLEVVPPGVAKFSDPGIKEQVLKAWKIAQVREKARKRADALAETVRKAGEESSMTDVLAGESITGDKKATSYTVDGRIVSNTVSVVSTLPFTWMEQSSAPSQNAFFAEPRLSAVLGTENIDDGFMKYVFNLGIGEVGVTHNHDRTVYYVVKVTDRDPKENTPETRPSPSLTAGFMQENFFSFSPKYFRLINGKSQELQSKWVKQLNDKYEVKWLQ